MPAAPRLPIPLPCLESLCMLAPASLALPATAGPVPLIGAHGRGCDQARQRRYCRHAGAWSMTWRRCPDQEKTRFAGASRASVTRIPSACHAWAAATSTSAAARRLPAFQQGRRRCMRLRSCRAIVPHACLDHGLSIVAELTFIWALHIGPNHPFRRNIMLPAALPLLNALPGVSAVKDLATSVLGGGEKKPENTDIQ